MASSKYVSMGFLVLICLTLSSAHRVLIHSLDDNNPRQSALTTQPISTLAGGGGGGGGVGSGSGSGSGGGSGGGWGGIGSGGGGGGYGEGSGSGGGGGGGGGGSSSGGSGHGGGYGGGSGGPGSEVPLHPPYGGGGGGGGSGYPGSGGFGGIIGGGGMPIYPPYGGGGGGGGGGSGDSNTPIYPPYAGGGGGGGGGGSPPYFGPPNPGCGPVNSPCYCGCPVAVGGWTPVGSASVGTVSDGSTTGAHTKSMTWEAHNDDIGNEPVTPDMDRSLEAEAEEAVPPDTDMLALQVPDMDMAGLAP